MSISILFTFVGVGIGIGIGVSIVYIESNMVIKGDCEVRSLKFEVLSKDSG
jgi:hypothetical protein